MKCHARSFIDSVYSKMHAVALHVVTLHRAPVAVTCAQTSGGEWPQQSSMSVPGVQCLGSSHSPSFSYRQGPAPPVGVDPSEAINQYKPVQASAK